MNPNQNPVGQPTKVSDVVTNSLPTNSALNPQQTGDGTYLSDIEGLDKKVRESKMPQELKDSALRSVERLRKMAQRGSYSGEFETVDKYIFWLTSIPWQSVTQDNLDISNAKQIMDSTHYGMNTVKDLILDYLAVMQLNKAKAQSGTISSPIMLFVGLQGVGKTSIAKSIAQSMGRKFTRISLGALGNVQALRGQSKAFLDAEPGQIVKALIRTGSMNPVVLLDEVDKVSGNSGLLNDVMAALLEILDPEQNTHFMDHYIDHPIDLSQVFFICTANNLGTLSAALLDRMEIIRFTSYTDEEKVVIAKNYSLPKVIRNTGIDATQVLIDDDVWPLLVRPVGYDAGLRQLERNLATLVRSAARMMVEGKPAPIRVTKENLTEFVLPDQGPLS
jgi:ATP-dependent Lon protease